MFCINKDMLLGYKYRLYPTKTQDQILRNWQGCQRWMYNHLLERNIQQYKTDKTFIWHFEMNSLMPELKKEYDWLKSPPGQSLQHVAANLQSGLRKYLKNKTGVGFPRFKKRGQETGINIPQQRNQIRIFDKSIHLPNIGQIKWKYHRPIIGELKSVSISSDGNQWYISCLIDDGKTPDPIEMGDTIGIDLGLKEFITTSDGEIYSNPKFLKKSEKLLKKIQRKYSKSGHRSTNKKSNNLKKKQAKLQVIHRKIKNQRKDHAHKTSRQIANAYTHVFTETLNIKGMVRNHKLAKAISDVSWYQFTTFLKYKLEQHGGQLIRVGRWFPSSKTCSNCQHVVPKLLLSERTFICSACGFEMDRDVNAAINIRDEGMRTYRAGTVRIQACGATNELIGDITDQDHRGVETGNHAPLGV